MVTSGKWEEGPRRENTVGGQQTVWKLFTLLPFGWDEVEEQK